MAAFRIDLGIGKVRFIYPSGFFLLLAANFQFVATSVTWTAPPPAWNQTDPTGIRTVDILVFNRSTQVHLKWNYILSPGSNLQITTFSIFEEGSVSAIDIGFKLHGSDGSETTTIVNNFGARFNISTSQVATLIINRATEREEATFQCKLTTSITWRYKVRVKLTELQMHWDQTPLNLSTVQEGNNITLQWRYSYTLGVSPSFRDATFFDLRDGEEKRIANKSGQGDLYVEPAYGDRIRIHIDDTKASMTILTALRSDRGRYKFKVETLNYNKLGGLTSIIEISVQFAANLTNVSRDQTVLEDSNMQLLCEATGEPTPNVTWIRVLEDGSSSEILYQGQTWDFPNISRSNSGTYRCTADNGFGKPVSHNVKVNVIYPAKIIKLASEHEVPAQQSVSLQCRAEGNPEPAYSWTPCDPQQSVCHESTLNISEVLSDIVYTCNVTNSLGSDTRNTSLVVASTVINVTLVITSESCTDGQFSQSGSLWSKLQETIDGIFTSEINYQNSILLDVRCGSVIVDLALKFKSTVKESDVLRTLQDAAKDGKLGDLDVNASSIVGVRPQTGATASTSSESESKLSWRQKSTQ
ncbi:hemicentin-1-like isoform X1 [Orbicella faveolata]|uniref:hemicentin-1-like isoform X1 n=1 Tax=Orbicella faveolata TaxID=48498 RepID=UPI0009E480D9|nr:hemicentin-1-like isoform X1 [Orbicella faveolata]